MNIRPENPIDHALAEALLIFIQSTGPTEYHRLAEVLCCKSSTAKRMTVDELKRALNILAANGLINLKPLSNAGILIDVQRGVA
ncbi:hypothetical protein [Desulfatitalea tepidiphila]|uniref:hypothetical protein n=1 Tax=Desulfatitalea tepidiphila TaxID=1185843 RepID=UPI00128FB1D8|nr:hypothetical protein [Desulfatitalea tepidiphila]